MALEQSLIAQKRDQVLSQQKQIIDRISAENIRATEEEQKLADEVIGRLSDRFSAEIAEKDVDEMEEQLSSAIVEECKKLDLPLDARLRIEKIVKLTVLGNGPIEEFLRDPTVTEVVVERFDKVVIERAGQVIETGVTFNNEKHLETIIRRIVQRVGRQINTANPIVDARLRDGSRVNATLQDVSPDGATLTIRKFGQNMLSGTDYIKAGSMDRRMLYFLSRCVVGRINIFVSGGTGTGKTTLLNALSHYIPENELIITIEDTLELQLQQKHVRRMEVRLSGNKDMMNVDQKLLLKAALRQRPDRIILGETRDGSIVDLISAMSTGHEGSMSTIHANSAANMCNTRIPILYGMNPEANFSEKSVALQVSEAIQVIAQLSRMPDGSRKITEISAVVGVDEYGKIVVEDIFRYDRESEKFVATGYIPDEVVRKIRLRGLDFDEVIFQEKEEV